MKKILYILFVFAYGCASSQPVPSAQCPLPSTQVVGLPNSPLLRNDNCGRQSGSIGYLNGQNFNSQNNSLWFDGNCLWLNGRQLCAGGEPLTCSQILLCVKNYIDTSSTQRAWLLSGNAGTNWNSDFIGTTDGQPLQILSDSFVIMNTKRSFTVETQTGEPLFQVRTIDNRIKIGDLGSNFNGTLFDLQDNFRTIVADDSAFQNNGIFNNIGDVRIIGDSYTAGTVTINDGTQGSGFVFWNSVPADGIGHWRSIELVDYSRTPVYANNAAAILGGVCQGCLYYTDVAGEHILKIAHP